MASPKTGDLVRIKTTGGLFTVIRGVYTKRFMDQEDHEMCAHGYGEYAGVYGSAIDVLCTVTNRKCTVRLRYPSHVEVISGKEEKAKN